MGLVLMYQSCSSVHVDLHDVTSSIDPEIRNPQPFVRESSYITTRPELLYRPTYYTFTVQSTTAENTTCLNEPKIKKWKTFFQAALDTKHKMGPAAEKLNLIHFNDVYNVEQRDKEPEGGAAR